MDLSVIIAGYNSWRYVPDCLASIRLHAGGIDLEVIFVDNASSDGSMEKLAASFPQVRRIANSRNLGFSRACNQGLEISTGEFILLLNPDAYLMSGTLAEAIDYLRAHDDAGILGGKVLNEDGTLQLACRRSIPTVRSAFFHFVGLSSLFPRCRSFGAYNLTYTDEDTRMDVEAVSGAFLMVSRQLIRAVGGLDERFFLYGEDLDWCLRAMRAGKRVVYWPKIVLRHRKGQSTRSRRYVSLYHFYHAMWLFYRKHYYEGNPWWENWAAYVGIWTAGLAGVVWKSFTDPFRTRATDKMEEGAGNRG
ncbi:MAG: glycosyltransferase family 2 protein [Acidobacteria bacterium]|nr:glycosyltransferase family 2 protein [Acidobacteriota bacterium]